jgi:integrase
MEALDYSPVHRAKSAQTVRALWLAHGVTQPGDITGPMVESFLDSQPSAKTAANKRSHIGAYLDWCLAHGLVQLNVAKAVRSRRPRPGKGADVLRPEQLSAVLRRLEVHGRPDGRSTAIYRSAVYRFLWATMLRVSEAWALTWPDIDQDNRVLLMPVEKARRAAVLPLSDDAMAALAVARTFGDGDRIFPVQVSHHTLRKDFEAAGVAGRGAFHRLRKGGITACVEAGVPLADLAKLSRHANVSVLVQSYYVPADPTLRKAQAALRLGAA